MHNFQIKAPTFGPRLKLIGHLRDGRRIGVIDSLLTRESSMALCRGYLVPPDGSLEQAQKIVAKFSPYASDDRFLIKERNILSKLPEVKGIPEMIGGGKAKISFWGRDGRGDICKIQRESPFFIMPELPGKNLDGFSLTGWGETFPKRKDVALLATKAFPALAEVLADLHENNVVHRDVKPNNVLFDGQGKGSLTLLDFERANWLDAKKARTDVGQFGFYPPELEFDKPEAEDVRTDVYALGATIFAVLTGRWGILYNDMEDPWFHFGLSCMFWGVEKIAKDYYGRISSLNSLSAGKLVAQSNMPSELKQTALGKYLGKLFHPDKHKRPRNMRKIAAQLRKLGGQLLTHEIWS